MAADEGHAFSRVSQSTDAFEESPAVRRCRRKFLGSLTVIALS